MGSPKLAFIRWQMFVEGVLLYRGLQVSDSAYERMHALWLAGNGATDAAELLTSEGYTEDIPDIDD